MTRTSYKAQAGAALMTVLIFLAVISLLCVTSLRSSTTDVRLARNEETRLSAIQSAQAFTEAIVSSPNSTPVIGTTGYSNCTAAITGCTAYAITVPAGYLATEVAAGHLNARVERMSPPEKPPPRVLESSIDKFSVASFQVAATYDRASEELGRAQLVEGVLLLVPKE
jgi:hypothetical protein